MHILKNVCSSNGYNLLTVKSRFISFPLNRYFSVLKTVLWDVKLSPCSTLTFWFQEATEPQICRLVSVTLKHVPYAFFMGCLEGNWKEINYDRDSNKKRYITREVNCYLNFYRCLGGIQRNKVNKITVCDLVMTYVCIGVSSTMDMMLSIRHQL